MSRNMSVALSTILVVGSLTLASWLRIHAQAPDGTIAPLSVPPSTPHFDAQIASQYAAEFGHTLNLTVSQDALVMEPQYMAPEIQPHRNVAPRPSFWLVRLKSPIPVISYDVEVNDTTGLVESYFMEDRTPMQRSSVLMRNQPGIQLLTIADCVPEADAVRTATSTLTKANAFSQADFHFVGAQSTRISDDTIIWFVTWKRMFHGIPYRDQAANATITGRTGALKGFSLNIRTPNPPEFAVTVTKSMAEKAASVQLHEANHTIGTLLSTELEVVEPSNFWEVSPKYRAVVPGRSRVAWVSALTIENGQRAFVFVDASTGKIIGGEVYGSRHTMGLPQPTQ